MEGSSQVASFTLRRLLLQLEWIPPLRLRYGRNDIPEGWFRLPTQVIFATFPTVSLKGITIQPHKLYLQRGGRQIAAPTDTLVGGSVLSAQVVFGAFPERHIGRSLRFR